jgi:hypothetical protein
MINTGMVPPGMGMGKVPPGSMTRPGTMVKPPMTRPGMAVMPPPGRRPMKKGGMVGGAGSGVGREMKSMGGSVRRKGSCGKNN